MAQNSCRNQNPNTSKEMEYSMTVQASMSAVHGPVLPRSYTLTDVEIVSGADFERILLGPIQNQPAIARHISSLLNAQKDGGSACLLVINTESDDGLLIHCDDDHQFSAAFAPQIRPGIEQQIRIAMAGLLTRACMTSKTTSCEFSLQDLEERLGFHVNSSSGFLHLVLEDELVGDMSVEDWCFAGSEIEVKLYEDACAALVNANSKPLQPVQLL